MAFGHNFAAVSRQPDIHKKSVLACGAMGNEHTNGLKQTFGPEKNKIAVLWLTDTKKN